MYFSRYINFQFNIFHAIAWSVGFHMFVIGFSPSFKNEAPVKLEEPSEKIRLKIANKLEPNVLKKNPLSIMPVEALAR